MESHVTTLAHSPWNDTATANQEESRKNRTKSATRCTQAYGTLGAKHTMGVHEGIKCGDSTDS